MTEMRDDRMMVIQHSLLHTKVINKSQKDKTFDLVA